MHFRSKCCPFKYSSNDASTFVVAYISGHRDRFRTIFGQLKSFYNQARNLQYFVSLITVPKLPENAPNFSSQVDFGAYTPPVVVVPDVDPEPLVDMATSTASTPIQEEPPIIERSSSVNFEQIIRDRDELIMHLQSEVDRLAYVLSNCHISMQYS